MNAEPLLAARPGPCARLRAWFAARAGVLTPSLVLVWLAFFCDYVLMTMVIPIFPLLDKPQVLIGALFAAKALCQIASAPIMSKFVDRHERGLVVVGLAMEAGSVLVFAATFSYGIWLVARAVSGVASAAIIGAGMAHLNRRYDNLEERAVAMGLATTGIVAGVCLGPVLGGTLYELHPALPFLLLAALQLSTAASALGLLPHLEASAKAADGVSIFSMLKEAAVLRQLGCLVIANAAISCLESTIALYLGKTFGMSVGQVGAVYLLTSAPCCLAAGFAGPIGNRLGRPLMLQTGLLLQGIFTALGPKSSMAVEALSLIGLGVGMGFVDSTSPPILGQVADEKFQGSGKIFVLSNVSVQTGFILGPIIGNAIVQASDFGTCSLVYGGLLVVYAAYVRWAMGKST